MSTFSATAEKVTRKPERVVVLSPDLFAYDWPQRPSTEVALGLRCISERDFQIGKSEASKRMLEMYGDGEGLRDPAKAAECWNDALLAYIVARAACDPNDADVPYFKWAQDESAKALTSAGLRYLWDEYMLIARGKGERRQVTDDELRALTHSLGAGALDRLDAATAIETRKHLAWCADALGDAGALDAPPDEEEDGDVYVVRASAQPAAP